MTLFPARSPWRDLAALSGGVVFAASLIYGGVMFVLRYDDPVAPGAPAAGPALINGLLFLVFGAHHSVLARPAVKARLARWLPGDAERVAYVWIASILFAAMVWLWQPVPGVLWRLSGAAVWALLAVQVGGGVLALAAVRRMDAIDLAGLRTALRRPPPAREATLVENGAYGLVRHPLYLAVLMFAWPVATMTATRFEMVLLVTAYVIVAIPFEERDLRRALGAAYGRYAAKVRWRLLPGLY
jgi:protein-S-isoprenylcysteine O-methyltransferase Ste14